MKNPDGTDNYAIEATQTQAAGLKGHLLLIHGTMDNNVPPYNTLLVADALIKANKEFDMLLIPNSGTGTRRRTTSCGGGGITSSSTCSTPIRRGTT